MKQKNYAQKQIKFLDCLSNKESGLLPFYYPLTLGKNKGHTELKIKTLDTLIKQSRTCIEVKDVAVVIKHQTVVFIMYSLVYYQCGKNASHLWFVFRLNVPLCQQFAVVDFA